MSIVRDHDSDEPRENGSAIPKPSGTRLVQLEVADSGSESTLNDQLHVQSVSVSTFVSASPLKSMGAEILAPISLARRAKAVHHDSGVFFSK